MSLGSPRHGNRGGSGGALQGGRGSSVESGQECMAAVFRSAGGPGIAVSTSNTTRYAWVVLSIRGSVGSRGVTSRGSDTTVPKEARVRVSAVTSSGRGSGQG